ncbi:bifunctional DNA primase/polymerase [Cellulomonas sp. WB94]|uniref:bifunctional DNA primase/polymerase n=1 Tax=Cellulomonas sp. WB94 TaxID=2173174 RepID=UPI0013049687|nr:bifunctional DNA primase/polymerase [Cellulomonas sp. WB94]
MTQIPASTSAPRGLLDRALAFAAAGTPVFPCVVGGKAPLTTNGFHDASTDLDQVRRWWTATPLANIATPTGAPGFDVLDVDVRPDGAGWAAYYRAEAAGLTDGWTRMIHTPSGGLHLYFPGTEQRNGSLRGQHVDFRSTGGYVLLPPSLGQTKQYSRRYELLRTRPGPGRPVDWAAMTALLDPPAERPRPVRSGWARDGVDPMPALAAHVAKQPEGNRDNALFWAACRAAEAEAADFEPLLAAAVSAGLTEREAARTVLSALRTTAQTPRPHRAAAAPSTASLTR